MYKSAALSPIVLTIYICLVRLFEGGIIGIYDRLGGFNIIIVGRDEHLISNFAIFYFYYKWNILRKAGILGKTITHKIDI